MANLLHKPPLSRRRIWLAFIVAVMADGLQLLSGPVGWLLLDQFIDVVGMAVETLLLGFHPLLLPTFVAELIPVLDMLPTWTGCVAMVVVLRRRQERAMTTPPPMSGSSDVIDV